VSDIRALKHLMLREMSCSWF